MNLQKASILLDTINALYKRMEMKGGNVPAIERDLMLENIRELYEFFVTNEASAPSRSTTTVPSPPHPPRTTTPPPPPPAPEPVRREPVQEVPTYNTPEPPKSPRKVERLSDYKPPRIIEIPNLNDDVPVPPPPVTKAPEYIPPTPPPPPPVPEPVKVVAPPPPPPAPEPVKVVAPPPPAPTPTADVPEFDTLFEHKAARELSEKLSERPIADLTRAVGYNDKMLFTNELFGGELVAFNSAVSRINSMGSFADARKYLAQLAEHNNWTEPNKTGSAKSFIKLVRRRFGA